VYAKIRTARICVPAEAPRSAGVTLLAEARARAWLLDEMENGPRRVEVAEPSVILDG
jgi:hypothetical protein